MKVYVFENCYYIGEDETVISNAIRCEEVELKEGESIKVVDGNIEIVADAEDLL